MLTGDISKGGLPRDFQLLVFFPHGPVYPIGASSNFYETREYKFESKA